MEESEVWLGEKARGMLHIITGDRPLQSAKVQRPNSSQSKWTWRFWTSRSICTSDFLIAVETVEKFDYTKTIRERPGMILI